jgi:hypothetical protein
VQCHKLLWWKVYEPNAVELQPDKLLQDRFDQGDRVRQDLLNNCERDTWAMVKVLEKLREVAGIG